MASENPCGADNQQERPGFEQWVVGFVDGDNHRARLWRFSVKRRRDLMGVIVPFFEEHPLITAKRSDCDRFNAVLQMMQSGGRLTFDGLSRIAALTEQVNRRQRSRFLESSEAIRQPTRPATS